ncbi:MAG: LysR family transcriptional regulator [Clostridia bacterium]|nr:LysR family transcriptional regulator [Clostridia bacterium]
MRLEQLQYFIAIVRCRSINKAAKELYISQPSLSKAIEAMEQELNCKLFLRTTKGIVPTEEGLHVYEDACIITTILDSWSSFSAYDRETAAEVHLIGTATFCDYLTSGFLIGMKEKYPNISIVLHEGRRSEIIGKMLQSDIKLGVASFLSTDPINLATFDYFDQITQKQNWEVDLLLEDPRRLLISAKNPLCDKVRVTPEDLKTLSLAVYSDRDDDLISRFRRYFGDTIYRLHNRGSIFRFVAEDRAATVFPTITTSADHFLLSGKIQPLEVPGLPLTDSRFYLIHQRTRFLKAAERVVAEELRTLCRNARQEYDKRKQG